MEEAILKSVVSKVHRQFPEFAGCQPKVRRQQASQAKSSDTPPTYLLTFQSTGQVQTSQGSKSLSRWVRVVVNDSGKILKITTSR